MISQEHPTSTRELEQELITMLRELSPTPIIITSQEAKDGSTVYAWKWHASYGTNLRLSESLRSALETAIFTSLNTPAPGLAITEARSEGLE